MIAQKLGADLFISIHANSSKSTKSHGATYYLDNNENEAVKVVRLENNEDIGKLELNYVENPMIHQILSELVVPNRTVVKKLGYLFMNQ